MGETKYRLAPKGFTLEQWETFNEDGIIFIENTLSNSTEPPSIGFLKLIPDMSRVGISASIILWRKTSIFLRSSIILATSVLPTTFSVNCSNFIRANFFSDHPAEEITTFGILMAHVRCRIMSFRRNYPFRLRLGIGLTICQTQRWAISLLCLAAIGNSIWTLMIPTTVCWGKRLSVYRKGR